MQTGNSPARVAIPSRSLGASLWHAFVPNRADALAKACKKTGGSPTLEQVLASTAVVAACARCTAASQPLSATEQMDLLRMLHIPAQRWAAAHALIGLNAEKALDALSRLSESTDPGLSCAALYALSSSSHPKAVEACANTVRQAAQPPQAPGGDACHDFAARCEFLLGHWAPTLTDALRRDLVTLAANAPSTPLGVAAGSLLDKAPAGEVAKETACAVHQAALLCAGEQSPEQTGAETRCGYLLLHWPAPNTQEGIRDMAVLATRASATGLRQQAADILAKLTRFDELEILAAVLPGAYFPKPHEPELMRIALVDMTPAMREGEIRRLLGSTGVVEPPQSGRELDRLSQELFASASEKGIRELVRIAEENSGTLMGAALEKVFWRGITQGDWLTNRIAAAIEPRAYEPSKTNARRARLECYAHMPEEIKALGEDASAVWRAILLRDKADFFNPAVLRHFIPLPDARAPQLGSEGLTACGFQIHEDSPWLRIGLHVSYPKFWDVVNVGDDKEKGAIITDELGISRYLITAMRDGTPLITWSIDQLPGYPRPPLVSFEELPAGTRRLEKAADFITLYDRIHVAVRSLDGKTSEYAEVYPQEDGSLKICYSSQRSFTLWPEWLPSPRFCVRTLSAKELVGKVVKPLSGGAARPADDDDSLCLELVPEKSLWDTLEEILGRRLTKEQVRSILRRFEVEPSAVIISWAKRFAERSRSRPVSSHQYGQRLHQALYHEPEQDIGMDIEM